MQCMIINESVSEEMSDTMSEREEGIEKTGWIMGTSLNS